MNLLIRPDAVGTHAEVIVTVAKSAYGGGHLLRPGESYRDIPYEVWRSYAGEEVDVLALRRWVHGLPSPPSPVVAGEVADLHERRRLFGQAPTLSWAILVNGILMFGFPTATLSAIVRELRQPGPGFDMVRFTGFLLPALAGAIVVSGPFVGAFIWREQNRARRTD